MMGSPFSKKPNPPLNGSSRDNGSSSNSSDMSSHEAGNHQDPELQNPDSILQQRTIGAISMLMSSEANSISFDVFRQITGCLLDNNHEVVNIILKYKKDVWNNPELFDLVEEYFANSLQTLEFCSSLEKCLKRARDSQLIIQLALRRFEEEEGKSEEEGNGKKKYERTLEELQHFKAAGDPFTEEFFRVFQSVCMKQFSMFEKLEKKKEKLDRKLKSVKAWRRVSSIIFASAFATVLICSVVAAVMAAPPVAAALAAAASIPLGSVGKWVDSLWKNYSKVLKGQKDVFITMEVATFVAVGDLEDIRVLVNRLEIHLSSLVENVDFALGDAEAVKFGIEEMEKKLGEFMGSVERLGKQVDRCSRNIQRARTIVLEKIRLLE